MSRCSAFPTPRWTMGPIACWQNARLFRTSCRRARKCALVNPGPTWNFQIPMNLDQTTKNMIPKEYSLSISPGFGPQVREVQERLARRFGSCWRQSYQRKEGCSQCLGHQVQRWGSSDSHLDSVIEFSIQDPNMSFKFMNKQSLIPIDKSQLSYFTNNYLYSLTTILEYSLFNSVCICFAIHAQDLQDQCALFKKVSDPVKTCLRKADPAAKAKAKAKAKKVSNSAAK